MLVVVLAIKGQITIEDCGGGNSTCNTNARFGVAGKGGGGGAMAGGTCNHFRWWFRYRLSLDTNLNKEIDYGTFC